MASTNEMLAALVRRRQSLSRGALTVLSIPGAPQKDPTMGLGASLCLGTTLQLGMLPHRISLWQLLLQLKLGPSFRLTPGCPLTLFLSTATGTWARPFRADGAYMYNLNMTFLPQERNYSSFEVLSYEAMLAMA